MSPWYASPDGEPPVCAFCGEPEERIAVGPAGAALCLRCAVRIADILRRGGAPPAPRQPIDPRDPGPPIMVSLEERPFGDLGNTRVDARLLLAIALRDGRVAAWLRERGVDELTIRDAFHQLDLGFDS
jgi:hypothetical protein